MNGSLIYRQQVIVNCFKAPIQVGTPVMNYDFRIDPPENIEIDSWSNDSGSRYNLIVGANETIGFGTVTTASLLILQPDNDILVQLTTSLSITGNVTIASAVIASPSTLLGISIGDVVTGNGIPAATTVIALSTTTITLSANATVGGAAVALQISGPGKPLYVNGGQSSILNVDFTGLNISNPSSSIVATGRFFFAGV